MNVGSLFTGIGGFDLGLERAGFTVAWQCEQDEFCRRVLAKHWPGVPCYEDVRALLGPWGDPGRVGDGLPDGAVPRVLRPEPVDVLCGGFPCQDLSLAGRRAGIDGEQSGLWAEMFRCACEFRPRYLVVENVPGLLTAGLGRVLGDLAAGGFDAEWDCLPASAFGAPHIRDRFWLVAYPRGARRRQDAGSAHGDEAADEGWAAQHDHVAGGDGQGGRARAVADAASNRRGSRREGRPNSSGQGQPEQPLPDVADPDCEQAERPSIAWEERDPWAAEPDVARMAHGVPAGVDRRRAIGNALVPQIAEWLGWRILEYEESRVAA